MGAKPGPPPCPSPPRSPEDSPPQGSRGPGAPGILFISLPGMQPDTLPRDVGERGPARPPTSEDVLIGAESSS